MTWNVTLPGLLLELYNRLVEKERYPLLRIIAKRIIMSFDGEIIDQQL